MIEERYTVEEVLSDKDEICRKVLEGLHEWFGIPASLEGYVNEAAKQVMFACYDADKVLGMCTAKIHSKLNCELVVIGVLPAYHRQGIGSLLLNAVEEYAAENCIKSISVKTVSLNAGFPEYARTWKFYESLGFELFEEFPTLWDQHNPCSILIKTVSI